MPTHKHDGSDFLASHGPKKVDASSGYEQTDVKVTGIMVFLACAGHLCGGVGRADLRHRQADQRAA